MRGLVEGDGNAGSCNHQRVVFVSRRRSQKKIRRRGQFMGDRWGMN